MPYILSKEMEHKVQKSKYWHQSHSVAQPAELIIECIHGFYFILFFGLMDFVVAGFIVFTVSDFT